jgi:hypothetical protein
MEGSMEEREKVLEISLQQLAEKMKRLDEVWQKQAIPGYQHHEIASQMVYFWKLEADEMLRMLYGVMPDREQ